MSGAENFGETNNDLSENVTPLLLSSTREIMCTEFDHEYGLKLSCSDDGLQSQSPLSTSLPVSFGISHPELQSGVAGVIRETGPLLPMTTTKESYIPQMPEPPQVSSKSGRSVGIFDSGKKQFSCSPPKCHQSLEGPLASLTMGRSSFHVHFRLVGLVRRRVL